MGKCRPTRVGQRKAALLIRLQRRCFHALASAATYRANGLELRQSGVTGSGRSRPLGASVFFFGLRERSEPGFTGCRKAVQRSTAQGLTHRNSTAALGLKNPILGLDLETQIGSVRGLVYGEMAEWTNATVC